MKQELTGVMLFYLFARVEAEPLTQGQFLFC